MGEYDTGVVRHGVWLLGVVLMDAHAVQKNGLQGRIQLVKANKLFEMRLTTRWCGGRSALSCRWAIVWEKVRCSCMLFENGIVI